MQGEEKGLLSQEVIASNLIGVTAGMVILIALTAILFLQPGATTPSVILSNALMKDVRGLYMCNT